MRTRLARIGMGVLGLSAALGAQSQVWAPAGVGLPATSFSGSPFPESSSALLSAQLIEGAEHSQWRITLAEAAGPVFLWLLSEHDPELGSALWHAIETAPMVGGQGHAHLVVPSAALGASVLEGGALFASALFLDGGTIAQTVAVEVTRIDEEPLGDPLDFDWGADGQAQPRGTVVSDVQPWSSFVEIRAFNADPTHPSKAVLFDSSAPGGVDPDLATPGPGNGNTEPLGELLVIAANEVDSDGDGLIDVPDAEDAGGTLRFDFLGPSTVTSLSLVDVDEGDAILRWYAQDDLVEIETVPAGGDNSVYTSGGGFGISRLDVELPGSAGIGGMTVYPCEAVIDFDKLSTGVPMEFEAGSGLDFGPAPIELFGGLGLFFLASNANPEHPNRALLFDSQAPTGGDDDLATPGAGQGNDQPQGKVLILAEDVVDADGDGLVDDPDDEAAGGEVSLNWYTSSGHFRGATLLDVDQDEDSWIEVVLDDGSGSVVVPLQGLGDNSSQTVDVNIGPTRSVRFHLAGSAAIAEIRICPHY